MPSPFAIAMAQADVEHLREFGEDVRITPMCPADGELKPASADQIRPARTVTGVFTLRSASDRLGGVRHGTELQGMSSIASAPATVWFSGQTLAELVYALRPGDRIALVERPGFPAYEIAKHAPTDLDDGTFPLVKAAR